MDATVHCTYMCNALLGKADTVTQSPQTLIPNLKVHKRDKIFSSDFEFFTILYLVKLKY